jgi:hypothetical protein
VTVTGPRQAQSGDFRGAELLRPGAQQAERPQDRQLLRILEHSEPHPEDLPAIGVFLPGDIAPAGRLARQLVETLLADRLP